ncbi:diacylglycerol kinase family protein [Parabacteroides sp. PF5-6]|uniref:diacylglycerol kinase n=1 Tax=Parabacteroides sp. PF5-6 TaxID=1742403 RepID=UPI0024064990|nr:diacylglycerol kinase family protein [Parabacteroides sp. PF5-6]MDF9831048.1 diacylglycerol kinase (ATP) [Parabacteroides sp. PF5-6]
MKNNGFTFRKRLNSFKYAFRGIARLFTHEPNSWIHLFATVCVLIAGWWLRIAAWEWVAVVGVIGLVLAAEAFNSAIEALGDAVSEAPNEYIKQAKDLAAGAVLLAAIMAAVVGLIVFLPKIL